MAVNKIYFTALDRWRFFAAFTVICAHYVTVFSVPQSELGKYLGILLTLDNSGAEAGVSFFFVLSGFLITYLLLWEKKSAGTISIINFYVRRVLRIWPLYILTVVIGFVFVPMVLGEEYKEIANWKLYMFFLANFDQIYTWHGAFSNPLLGVHWSVAVEEQFYLLWPLLLLLPIRFFPQYAFFVILGSFIFQVITKLPTHTVSSLHDLAIGGLTAWYGYTHAEAIQDMLKRLGKVTIVLIYFSGFLLLVARYQLVLYIPVYENLSRTINALFFAFIMVEQCFNIRPLVRRHTSSVFSYLGKISYGLYLLHPVALLIIKSYLPGRVSIFWIQFPLTILFSIILSMISYHLIEVHFLKFKEKFSLSKRLS